MKYLFIIVLTYSVFVTSCHSVATDESNDPVNCTAQGYAAACCTTRGCVLINCTDGEKCQSFSDMENWGDTCETGVNQCETVMDANVTSNNSTNSTTSNVIDTNNSTTGAPSTAVPAQSTSSNHTENNTSTTEPVTSTTEPVTSPTDKPLTTPSANTTIQHTTVQPTSIPEKPIVTTLQPDVTQPEVSSAGVTETTHPHLNTSDTAPIDQDVPCDRQFDTASFIGGMVFLAGLAAMGGFIYMYYKSRQDVNYRML